MTNSAREQVLSNAAQAYLLTIRSMLGAGVSPKAAAVARRLGLVGDAPPPPGSRTID